MPKGIFFSRLLEVNNRIVDHFQKSGLFSDFQDGFRSSQSTPDLRTVSNRCLQVVLDGISSQEYPVKAGVP